MNLHSKFVVVVQMNLSFIAYVVWFRIKNMFCHYMFGAPYVQTGIKYSVLNPGPQLTHK